MGEFSFEAIGTQWTIQVEGILVADCQSEVLQRIEEFDQNYSRFREDSLVTAMAHQPGTYQLPPDAQLMMDMYEQLYRASEGHITPLIGDVLVQAGYDAEYSLQPTELHAPPSWHEALTYDFPQLIVHKPVLLDFGAIGKGYLVDIVGDLLLSLGATAYSIDAGGDIKTFRKSLRIGLENPDNDEEAVGVLELRQGSLCGSAGNRRKWGKFHHIIDPITFESPQEFKAVWAVAETALLADAATTMLYFMDPPKIEELFPVEYARVHESGALEQSIGFPGTFFTNES